MLQVMLGAEVLATSFIFYMMVPHASPQTGVAWSSTCHTDYDCEGNQFCAKPGFMCRDCINCTEHQREVNVGISCSQSVLDCGPCLSGDGCEPSTPAGSFPDNSQPVYLWVLVSLILALITVGTTLCLFKLLRRKICAASHTSIFTPSAETGRGAPTPHARPAPPNYNTTVNNNNDISYVPVQLRPSSPALETVDYNSYRIPTTEDEESGQMLAKQSNPLHVTGLKERDLNQAAVVFINGQEAPPSYDSLNEGNEDLPEEEETLDSIWVPGGAEAASVPPTSATAPTPATPVEFRGLLGEARGTILIRPPRYDEGIGDTDEEPPAKVQRTVEENNPSDVNPNESSSSAQLRITDVMTTTQGSNAIALPTPGLDFTPSHTSGYAHYNNHQSRAGPSSYPPPNSPPSQTSESQNGQTGNLMVNISIQQVNNLKNMKI